MSATMTVETGTGVTTATMFGGDFAGAVQWAATAAGTDRTLPILQAVNVSFGDTPHHYDSDHSARVAPYGVSFAATDRYRLTWSTAVVDAGPGEGPAPFSVNVPAKELLAVAKAVPRPGRGMPASAVTVTVTVDVEHTFESVRFDVLQLGQLVASFTIRQAEGSFPSFRNLIPTFDRDTAPPIGAHLNGGYLASIATAASKVKGKRATVGLRSQRAHGADVSAYATKPVAVAVSDAPEDAGNPGLVVSGLIMPVRMPN